MVLIFLISNKIGNEGNFIKLIKTVQAKITIFENLAISKVIHLSTLVTNVSQVVIDQLNEIQKDFIWKQKHPKLKLSTVCNTHENGALKNIHIPNKLASLQCSWIK